MINKHSFCIKSCYKKVFVVALSCQLLFWGTVLYATESPKSGLPKNYPYSREEVHSSQYPWSAIGRINLSGAGHCTGTLVGRRTVVTAAHCLWNKATDRWWPAQYVHFVPGYQRDHYPAHSRVKSFTVSPEFVTPPEANDETMKNDWAIVTLEKPLGDKAGVIGWRSFSKKDLLEIAPEERVFKIAGYRSDRPHVLSVDKKCEILKFTHNGKLIEHNCATLFGDSGGPMLFKEGDSYQLIGVSSAMKATKTKTFGIVVPTARFEKALIKHGVPIGKGKA